MFMLLKRFGFFSSPFFLSFFKKTSKLSSIKRISSGLKSRVSFLKNLFPKIPLGGTLTKPKEVPVLATCGCLLDGSLAAVNYL